MDNTSRYHRDRPCHGVVPSVVPVVCAAIDIIGERDRMRQQRLRGAVLTARADPCEVNSIDFTN